MLLLPLLFSFVWCCHSAGLPDDIYYKISVPEGAACYRLLNGTHQFGCHTSKEDGQGVLVVLNKTEETEDIGSCWRDRFADYHGGFFVMIDSSLLTSDVISLLRASRCVRGLLLTDRGHAHSMTSSMGRSDDSRCPNEGSSFYKDGCSANAWNRAGATIPEGLRMVDWDKQMVYLYNETYITEIEKCHSLFNLPSSPSSPVSFPLCAASFSLRSSAAGNSEICHRRSQNGAKLVDLNVDASNDVCHPLSGRSIISFLPPNPFNKSSPSPSESKYMILAARLDSFGLIPEISPGEISVMTSLIALLAAAKGIGNIYDAFEGASKKSNNYLLMTMFNGESFDYIGSSSLFYDMSTGGFPYPEQEKSSTVPEQVIPSQIVSMVEAQQLTDQALYLIADGRQMREGGEKVSALVSSLISGALSQNLTLSRPVSDGRLPPSSWHSLARFNPQATGIVIAPFEKEYTYTRVNSMSDRNVWTAPQRGAAEQQISAAAAAMLRAAADHVELEEKEKEALMVDRKFVSTLFDCFILSNYYSDCDFIQSLQAFSQRSGEYYGKDTYIGVMDRNRLRNVAYTLLMYATGTTSHTGNVKDEKTCNDLSTGQKLFNYHWMTDPLTNITHCYRHSVFVDESSSPAFKIPDYDFANTTYSTWTESLYELDDLQLYLVEKKSFELWMLLVGLLISLLSILIVGRCEEKTFIIDEGERAAEQGEPL